jgi:co-chaperonin GroES (HSP10)
VTNRALHPRKDVIAVRRTQQGRGTVVAVASASPFAVGQPVTFSAHAGVEFKTDGDTLLLLSSAECMHARRNESGE